MKFGRDSYWRITKFFLIYFLPSLVVVSCIALIIFFLDVRTERRVAEAKEALNIATEKKVIVSEFKSIVSDLVFIAEVEIQEIFEGDDTHLLEALAEKLVLFSATKRIYDQIRFLNETGREVLRVNYNNGNPSIVPEEQLQSKENRYYVQEILRLGQQEVYVSPFDYNVEQGEIETPLKPTIRFGASVFDSLGRKRGIILFNYLATKLTKNLKSVHANATGHVMLYDSEGFKLMGMKGADKLGFMYEDEDGKSKWDSTNLAWQQISGVESGQFLNPDGLFTFATIHPLWEAKKAVTGLDVTSELSAHYLNHKGYDWKVVSHVLPEELFDGPNKLLSRLFPLYAILVLVLAIGSRRLASLSAKRKEMEESDKLRSIELENLVESLNRLVEELQLNVQQAKHLLDLVHGEHPRYIDTNDLTIFSHAISLPCNDEGGDHYFVQKTDGNKTLISLKDQSGHSVGCLLRSIVTDMFYKSLINNHKYQTLEKLLDNLNRNMYKAGLFSEDEFFTSIDVEIDNESLKVRYASCGHPPFIVIRGNQILALPEEGGKGHNLPLAIFEDAHFSAGEFQLQCGDKLIFYTDGLTEATIKDGIEGIATEKLIEMISQYASLPVSDIVNHLVYAVAERAGETIDPLKKQNSSKDDITMLGVEIENSHAYNEEIVQPKGVGELDCFFKDLLERLLVEWRERGFEQEHRLAYVLTESLINAYKHGNRGDTSKSITVRWRWGNDLHFEVIDEGEGFDHKNIPEPTRPEKLENSHGRGIFIIRYCADHISWKDSGRHFKTVFQKQQKPVHENDIVAVKEYIDLWRKDDSLFEDIRLFRGGQNEAI